MPRVRCPVCRTLYRVPAGKAGKKMACVRCGTRLRLSRRPVPVLEAVSVAPGGMIACPTCTRPIAAEAATCPGCGAPSRWVHPRIAAFLDRRRDFEPFDLEAEGRGFTLVCRWQRPRQFLDVAADAVGSLVFFAPLSVSGLATLFGAAVGREYLEQALREAAGKDCEALVVDVRTVPARWQSTDDVLWEDVLDFFGL